jgi:sugar lactone lactonase YvrE
MPLLLVLALAIADGPRIESIAGTSRAGYGGDGGPAVQAQLNGPFAVAFDPAGNLHFSDTGNHCVRRVDAKTGLITTIAGTGKKGFFGDGGSAVRAELNEPYGIAFDATGNLFIVDRLNARIRRVDAKTGVITTAAGTGTKGYSGDGGPADKAELREPNGIAIDRKGRLYIADVADQRVRVVKLSTGVIVTFAGTGKKESEGDGRVANTASLAGPRAVAVLPNGDILVCEREGNRVRKIDIQSGIISTIAGTGKKGYTGDGGPAAAATFNGPKELASAPDGTIYVVDTENHAIRRIDGRTGVIATLVGTGKQGDTGDGGPASQATLGRPHGATVGPDGAVYIGDTLSNRIRKVK